MCLFNALFAPMISFLAVCAQCGFSLPPIYYLCRNCWHKQLAKTSGFIYENESFSVYSLWQWESADLDTKLLLYRRKKSILVKAENILAQKMLSILPETILQEVDVIAFPAKDQRDHTWHLANSIGKILKIPTVGIILKQDDKYKTYGRRRRFYARQSNHESLFEVYTYPLMIDDIYTTGATIRAVWRALNRPKQATSLCLAYKTFNSVESD